jgi:hypothetical protein
MILMNFAGDPQIDQTEIKTRLFEAARIEKINKLFVQNPAPPPDKQLEMANLQADLGRKRAAEQKDASQAILNLALAKKASSDSELGWFDQQLELMRGHLEALNTMVKAADVDAKFHGHNVHMKIAQAKAKEASDEGNGPAPGGEPPVQPDVQGSVRSQLPAMAPSPDNGGLPPVPPPSGGQPPPGPAGTM